MGLETLIAALVILVVIVIAVYLVDMIGLPHPINWIARAIVVLIGLIYLLQRSGLL